MCVFYIPVNGPLYLCGRSVTVFPSLTSLTFSVLSGLNKSFSLACKLLASDSLLFHSKYFKEHSLCSLSARSPCVCVEVCVAHKHIHDPFPLSAQHRLRLSCMTEHTQWSCPSKPQQPKHTRLWPTWLLLVSVANQTTHTDTRIRSWTSKTRRF